MVRFWLISQGFYWGSIAFQGFAKESNWFLKDLVRNLINFQLISNGFGKDFNWFLMDLVWILIDFQLIPKGFGKECNWFPIDL